MIGQLFRLSLSQMGFWASWTMIPILVEILPSIISIIRLLISTLRNRKKKEMMAFPEVKPYVSIIIPVFNSKDSLYECIKSVDNSSYPHELIQIILVDNKPGGDKECFDIFDQMHNHEFSHLNMVYLRSAPGKAKALNTAIYSCIGTYIVNIDSDGILERDAISNLILKYENDSSIAAMTGVILTQKDMIQSEKSLYKRILQKNEYFEYAHSFLTGRTKETTHNQLFTMAGAFSSFRKEVLISTFLYDVDTVGEDTDMTFQIRVNGGQKVDICEDAFFFVDPIEDLDTLYIQRQRWQRGQLEVVGNYMTGRNHITGFFKDFLIRRMIIDHTFIFPKMIWLFASFILIQFGYSYRMILLSYGLIYLLYFFVSVLNTICTLLFFNNFKEERQFYVRNIWCLLTLPIYTFICSWFRLVGVLNSITSPAKWDTKKFKEEKKQVIEMIRNDFMKVKKGR
ncbi:TIGR03111 family XrtG-associated glycosyltransferase [Lactococcus garvieae]|nr:TIGR03111 family XrtG-associated glycosyltransferase [Lactococcus garvieae]QPS71001.1 putative glycosyltransferase, exosortase G system-associated [Lactococcus garvieae]